MKLNLILHNAQVYTVDSARPWAESVAITDGNITAVGSDDEIKALKDSDTKMIDLGGRLVLPGLIDAHVHFLQYAVRQQQVKLFGLTDLNEVRKRVRQAVEQAEPGQWVQGWGWSELHWDTPPSAAILDEIAPNTPVVLARLDMHTWWTNSVAMKQANVTRDTPDPIESRIERDTNGEPNGLFREWNAIQLIQKHVPRPDSTKLYGWLKEAIAEAHRLGLTGIHDQRVEREGRQTFRLYQALRRQNELKLRVHMNISSDFLTEAATLGLQPGFGDDRFWIGHVKAFADGTLGSQTALMLAPFEGSSDNLGLAVTPADELWELAVQADKAGFPLSVHAIGDRAVRDVINVMSEFEPDTSTGRLPHRIEHVQLLHPEDLSRLHQHGIVASMQPFHVSIDWAAANKIWGQRSRYAYAMRTLLDHGTHLAFGSDAPVAPLSPMLGIYAAVTRQDEQGQPEGGWYPEESVSVAEAIHGYTMGSAQVAGKAHRHGSISPGKWADMIVLSENIFDIDPAKIAETEVDMTIFNGEVVFSR